MRTSRVVVIASILTVVVTLYSLSELQRMTNAASRTEQHLEATGVHKDWRTIAERAVKHVEQLPMHAGSLFHRSAIQGAAPAAVPCFACPRSCLLLGAQLRGEGLQAIGAATRRAPASLLKPWRRARLDRTPTLYPASRTPRPHPCAHA